MLRRFSLALVVFLLAAQLAYGSHYTLITILHTNDIHGRILPGATPGLARVASVVRDIRAEMPNVILLDAGDFAQHTYEDYFSKGLASVSAMNAVGYTAAAYGNHEFDYGQEAAKAIAESASFPLVAANIRNRSSGNTWENVQPYFVANVEGVRIGIIGLATPETATLQWPPSIADISIDDPLSTAKTLVPEVRTIADVVVVISHLGYKADLELAESVPGIDFIVGGHSHTTVDEWQWVGETLIVQAGEYSKYLGRIDFIVQSKESGAKIASVNGKSGRVWNDLENPPLGKVYPTSPLIAVSTDIVNDLEVELAYKPYRDQTEALLSEKIGEAVSPIALPKSGSADSPASNLVADAIKSYASTDVALVDLRSLQAGLQQGDITVRNAFDMIRGFTRQEIVAVRITGRELKEALAEILFRDNRQITGVSGATVRYTVDLKGKRQITELAIDGQPVAALKEYTVSGQAYVIQNLLRLYPALEIINVPTGTSREATAEHIRSSKSVSPVAEERVSKLTKSPIPSKKRQ